LARENTGWGYDRIVGALANLGYPVSDQTVGNILRRHGIGPVPERSQTTTWRDFIRRHMDVLAGTDFFTVEVLTWRGLVTHYVLFFIHLESRRVYQDGRPEARVTGTPQRPIVAVAAGLIRRYPGDSNLVRVYLLHEFGHLANRDVSLFSWTVGLNTGCQALIISTALFSVGTKHK
jgi:hypothetical protein